MRFEIAPKSTEQALTWYAAVEYIKTLGDGWRLPTKEELNQIYESKNDFQKDGYWCSTEFDWQQAWEQEFDSGCQDYYGKTSFCYTRAVKDILGEVK